MCEEKQSSEMLKLGGGFWDGGLDVVEKDVSGKGGDVGDDDEEEEEWESEAVSALESLGSVSVLDG
jgi:nuclear pore complex protein Nup107